MTLSLHYSAISDVGRVRRENQDSGYAGPWLLTVCDGVGGAVRGDLASSTAVQALRKLDQQPDEDILGQVAGDTPRHLVPEIGNARIDDGLIVVIVFIHVISPIRRH